MQRGRVATILAWSWRNISTIGERIATMTLLERTPDALVYRYFPESDESHGGIVPVGNSTKR
jgi:hypothetical protein